MNEDESPETFFTQLKGVLAGTAVLLLLPLVAMQFTDEVAWSGLDFVVAGALLFVAGMAYVMAARWTHNVRQRLALGMLVAGGLLFVWIELAVGVFGSPLAGS